MKKVLKTYKHNTENNTLEITYKLITENNLKVTVKEIVEYKVEKEKELLKEIRDDLELKISNYHYLGMQNISLPTTLYQEYASATLGLITQTPLSLAIFALCTCLGLKDTKEFINTSLELKRIEKSMFYINNEVAFDVINEHIGITRTKIKSQTIKNKLDNMCKREEDINLNSIQEFSSRELKKLNNFYIKTLK